MGCDYAMDGPHQGFTLVPHHIEVLADPSTLKGPSLIKES